MRRYLDPLRRFAHRRLPPHARSLVETDDLVQNALIRALHHLETFEPRRDGAFLAYLRQIVLNQVRDAVRKASREGAREDLREDLADGGRDPLEETIGSDMVEKYQAALARLEDDQCEAVVLRIEEGLTYAEIAARIGRSSPDAARMVVTRSLVRIAELMSEET